MVPECELRQISPHKNHGEFCLKMHRDIQREGITGGPTPLVVAAGPGVPGGPSSPYAKRNEPCSTY